MRVAHRQVVVAGIAAAALLLGGCAYYNTFYLARRYYDRSLIDVPYAVDKTDVSTAQQLPKSIDLSQKLIEHYPKSKWVDDAYLLWARALIANDDPREAVRMLEAFNDLYPKSSIAEDARFYLGVAYARSHKYERALEAFDTFLAGKPRGELVPYAYLERSRVLMSLERPGEAADAASYVVEKAGGGPLGQRGRIQRADARFAQKAFDKAREDFRTLGRRASNDEDRLTYLLRETDCLEGAQDYDAAMLVLKDAIAHEVEPTPPDTAGGKIAVLATGIEQTRYGRLLLRIGTVHLEANRLDDALTAYRRVLADYGNTSLGAEAQFRIGYAYETGSDDFDRARTEYGKVRDQNANSPFVDQAATRLTSLERLAQTRGAKGDTLARAAESEFVLAEQYLFQLDKPDRALEEYQKVEHKLAGTKYAAKAITAQGWILSRKLKRKAAADSLFWKVVHEHPGTESQLAARDYLEEDGERVPDSLIVAPEPPPAPPDTSAADTSHALTRPPEGPFPLGGPVPVTGVGDSLHLGPRPGPFVLPPIRVPSRDSTGARDTTGAVHGPVAPARTDTTHVAPGAVPPGPVAPARTDTTRTNHPPSSPPPARTPPPGTPAPTDTTTRSTHAPPPGPVAPRDTTVGPR